MKRTLSVGGTELLVHDEEFRTIREDWSEYELASGAKVRVKLIVQKISRVLDKDGNPEFDTDGDPRVVIRHQVQIVASGGPSATQDGEAH